MREKLLPHRLLIWAPAYDTFSNRDTFILKHLKTAGQLCTSSPQYDVSVRLFIATRSLEWINNNSRLITFAKEHKMAVKYPANISMDFLKFNDVTTIVSARYNCVEFSINYYSKNVGIYLPSEHRSYFQEHLLEFDWFFYIEEDAIYSHETYWKLLNDTDFALHKISANTTHTLMNKYMHKAHKPSNSTFGRLFFLPSLFRYEVSPNSNYTLTKPLSQHFDYMRLSDMFGWQDQSMIEAVLYLDRRWWIQGTNYHNSNYLLPQAHLQRLVLTNEWTHPDYGFLPREYISSLWLDKHGYVRIVSITDLELYLIHHAANRYYNPPPVILAKISMLIRELGFVYSSNKKFCLKSEIGNQTTLMMTSVEDYFNNIANCFPLSFTYTNDHDGKINCEQLQKFNDYYNKLLGGNQNSTTLSSIARSV